MSQICQVFLVILFLLCVPVFMTLGQDQTVHYDSCINDCGILCLMYDIINAKNKKGGIAYICPILTCEV